MHYLHKRFIISFFIIVSLATLLFPDLGKGSFAFADKADDLRQKIQERNDELKQLEQEISQYQAQVALIGTQANTLKSSVQSLEITRKKLLKDIQVTQNKIQTTNLIIQQLQLDIGDKENRINKDKESITQTLRKLNLEESKSMIETLLEFKDLSEFWNEIENLKLLQSNVKASVDDLQNSKTKLEQNKSQTEVQKNQLISFTNQLKGETKVVEANKAEKTTLLVETKNKEANYKKILEDKVAAKKAFEDDLANLESELKRTIDPNSIPRSGSGVLHWPLDNVRITQYFGNTSFATQNPQAYNGKGHNGIDLAASTGTRVLAALSGTVVETGNTSALPTCYSYGKWILIRHDNGLSTLYGHLSTQIVSAGQRVNTGDVIGYSGATGYVTGPHLHLSVFASQGVTVEPLVNSVRCKDVRIPVAPQKAYLNPLSYL